MSDVETLAHEILSYAVAQDAKHIWVEPQLDCLRIRIRFGENTIKEYIRLPKDQALPLVTQFKNLAGLNTSLHKVAQRGWLAFSSNQADHLIWTTTLPTLYGEKVVVWLVPNDSLTPELRQPTCL